MNISKEEFEFFSDLFKYLVNAKKADYQEILLKKFDDFMNTNKHLTTKLTLHIDLNKLHKLHKSK
jgi:hypothetical protein